ncbi:hypothetical protein [Alkalimarinus alittae]|uniref:Solute-binding protein family 3/N-terminal domain-containing protein n=1 Tax=Alkalimarinus alittae TaxID=2961619 RepID=A0ABY6N4I2_9ALTE|nr:hypothetical protein [Alkalimarinus alittae]UZE96915.1 hypothetical protein NKI27_03955 [Alkalimarinus alittae]
MAPSPDNSGLYQALYTEAAKRIDCTLIIKRFPKKRALRELEAGKVDIYPSTGFDEYRSQYMFYIPNGLHRKEHYYGLTPANIQDINSLSDIKSTNLNWIIEAGRTTANEAKNKGITYQELVGLTASKAIKMISWNRKVFYQIDTLEYNNYLKKHSISDLTHLNIKTHTQCCPGKSQKLYAGISRQSPLYKEEPNPYYNPAVEISPDNFPTQQLAGSIGYKLSLALQDIYSSGTLNLLLNQHNVTPP